MIETAIQVTQGRVPASAIRELIEAGRDLRHGEGPSRAMMVGNSLKSDIVPALEAGCSGAWTWSRPETGVTAEFPIRASLSISCGIG